MVKKWAKKRQKFDHHGVVQKINGTKVTEYDVQICKHLNEHCSIREVARKLRKPHSGIIYRIDRLVKAGLLLAHAGAYNTKTFDISANLQPFLTYGEEVATVAVFTAHNMGFKFPLLSGNQPTSHLPKLYFLRNVGSAEKGIKMHILFPFRLSWLISGHCTDSL
ncbi:winged helix-turn-helix domain-containing protein [Methanococcoides sp.]|uniref:winged helix-turn-helix domain-containing protein n=1 Tax=Methanococcoides sp. TaxID=1966350 RepID=UPI00272E1760|nr:winged helix-turn-helix domain-containing protein [Methanococcoides sp.]